MPDIFETIEKPKNGEADPEPFLPPSKELNRQAIELVNNLGLFGDLFNDELEEKSNLINLIHIGLSVVSLILMIILVIKK